MLEGWAARMLRLELGVFAMLCIALPGWQVGGQVVYSAQQSDDICDRLNQCT
jgi:hypothetical protein